MNKLAQRALVTIAIFGVSILAATSAFAASNYKLACDDDSLFEGPMTIVINGNDAKVNGNFSGPGDAIFSVEYSTLDVLDVVNNAGSDELQSVTITQPRTAKSPVLFQLSLKATKAGELEGQLEMQSTDDDKMPYEGQVTCQVSK